jgi:hypothetical protein
MTFNLSAVHKGLEYRFAIHEAEKVQRRTVRLNVQILEVPFFVFAVVHLRP